MEWKECNFLESHDYQQGFLSKEKDHYDFCRMKDKYDWDAKCDKEKCVIIKIANKLGV